MKCRICKKEINKIFNKKILNKYNVDYFLCDNCDFIQTEKTHWLNEAYSKPINNCDTGILERNINFSRKVSSIIYFLFNKEGKFLDDAGGYGIFTRLMRDIGFDFYWNDIYTENMFAIGFEENKAGTNKFECITFFETLEHLETPLDEINKIFEKTDTIILSTRLKEEKIPNINTWDYYGFSHGQHISFYSKKTLQKIAEIFKLNFYTVEGLHILTRKKINYLSLKMLIKNNFIISKIIRKKMKSKTQSDSEYIINRNI